MLKTAYSTKQRSNATPE